MKLSDDRSKCAHLLRRFGLGASEAEIDFYVRDGINAAVDRLVEYGSTDEGFNYAPSDFANNKGVIKLGSASVWWHARLVLTQRPLQEKMTLFWHDHFATSASKVLAPEVMLGQNEVLRSNATGSFRTLLKEVSQDPAMMFWLDNQYNIKGKPNENFAREVMELFTLGIGHYSEKDVQEAARAFTGWTYTRGKGPKNADKIGRKADFRVDLDNHDEGAKKVLEVTGPLGGEDVLDLLCDHPQTALHLTKKIWEWFVYPSPDQSTLESFAQRFRASKLDIATLLKAIMKSDEFYSDRAYRAIYKTPIDFAVAPLRQLGVGQLMPQTPEEGAKNKLEGPLKALGQTTRSMGMQLFFPPDVSGWEMGAAWITSATMIERIRWGERIFGVAQTGAKKGAYNITYPSFGLFESDPTPAGVVKRLTSIFDVELPADKLRGLEAAAEKASGGAVTSRNANATAGAVSRLIFGTPEFQLA